MGREKLLLTQNKIFELKKPKIQKFSEGRLSLKKSLTAKLLRLNVLKENSTDSSILIELNFLPIIFRNFYV